MDTFYVFVETESEFYQYLTEYGGVNKHSRTNYMSWLKFLSQTYRIDKTITNEYIDYVIDSEKKSISNRTIYSSEKDLVNFKSALRKYYAYVQSDFAKNEEQTILSEINKIEQNAQISKTEKKSIIKSRVGQGVFREHLIRYWGGCSVSCCRLSDILIASHIKPWRVADNDERLNIYNGLLLLPNYDKLFDKGYISFSVKGKIIFSSFFPQTDRTLLNISSNTSLLRVEQHRPFLLYHNHNCLMQ